MEYLLRRDVVRIGYPSGQRKPIGSDARAFLPSGVRFGDGLEKDARGREAGRASGGRTGK